MRKGFDESRAEQRRFAVDRAAYYRVLRGRSRTRGTRLSIAPMKITRTRRLANVADVHANSSGDKSGMELEIEESEEQRGRGTFDRVEKRVDRDSERREPAA